jgi:phage shock protein PspC (stress-responsive transcriptional regulator)
MTVDDRDENRQDPEEPQAERPEAGGDRGAGDQPEAGEPAAEGAQPTEDEERTRPGEPRPEDPRAEGPQAPADEAPTVPLGAGAGSDSQPPPRRLVRPREGRVIGGVCAGIGRYFNTDPVIVRIAAVVLALFGGAGVLLYVAALLLMPAEDSAAAQATAASGDGRNRALVIAGVVLLLLVSWPFLLGGGFLFAGILIPIAFLVAAGVLVWWLVSGEGPSGDAGDIARRAALGVGVLILCAVVALGGAWAAAAGGGALVATLVIGAGVAIVAGAFFKPVRWLILPAVVLGLSAGTVQAAGIDLDGGVGDREYRPASVTDLRDRYELGMGELKIDLREADLPAGDTPLEIDLGMGQTSLIVPDDVCVATNADIGVGAVSAFDTDNGGVDVEFKDSRDAPPDTSRLVVDADLGVGELRVGNASSRLSEASVDFEEHGWRGDYDLGTNSACLDTGERESR